MSSSPKHAQSAKSDPRDRKFVLHLIAISIGIIVAVICIKVDLSPLWAAIFPGAGPIAQEIFDFVNRI